MNMFELVIILYIAIGIIFVGILNGFSHEKIDGTSVVFMIFYPLVIVIILVFAIIRVLYKLGERLGRRVEKFTDKIDW